MLPKRFKNREEMARHHANLYYAQVVGDIRYVGAVQTVDPIEAHETAWLIYTLLRRGSDE